MGKVCVAVGCHNRQDVSPNLHFYRIPAASATANRRSRWIAAIRRDNWTPSPHDRLCSSHFISGQKNDHPFSPDYVPSIFQHSPFDEKKSLASFKQFEEMKKRKIAHKNHPVLKLGESDEITERSVSVKSEMSYTENCLISASDNATSIGTQTELTGAQIEKILRENQFLKSKNLCENDPALV
ncbi:THAP domain-containing protein 1-like [Tubulanus polymorphus]|uniref:THAP domain-containing protein 1-like n=1 Tax=Tubulanus polymorphus TaxID=672921 RepID=UPI003DA4EA61